MQWYACGFELDFLRQPGQHCLLSRICLEQNRQQLGFLVKFAFIPLFRGFVPRTAYIDVICAAVVIVIAIRVGVENYVCILPRLINNVVSMIFILASVVTCGPAQKDHMNPERHLKVVKIILMSGALYARRTRDMSQIKSTQDIDVPWKPVDGIYDVTTDDVSTSNELPLAPSLQGEPG